MLKALLAPHQQNFDCFEDVSGNHSILNVLKRDTEMAGAGQKLEEQIIYLLDSGMLHRGTYLTWKVKPRYTFDVFSKGF